LFISLSSQLEELLPSTEGEVWRSTIYPSLIIRFFSPFVLRRFSSSQRFLFNSLSFAVRPGQIYTSFHFPLVLSLVDWLRTLHLLHSQSVVIKSNLGQLPLHAPRHTALVTLTTSIFNSIVTVVSNSEMSLADCCKASDSGKLWITRLALFLSPLTYSSMAVTAENWIGGENCAVETGWTPSNVGWWATSTWGFLCMAALISSIWLCTLLLNVTNWLTLDVRSEG